MIGMSEQRLREHLESALVHAMRAEYETAAPFIGIAIVLDMLDGRIARLTGTASDFGMEFDSLADIAQTYCTSLGIGDPTEAVALEGELVRTMAPWMRGCSVLTRPPSISGNSTPPWRRAANAKRPSWVSTCLEAGNFGSSAEFVGCFRLGQIP